MIGSIARALLFAQLWKFALIVACVSMADRPIQKDGVLLGKMLRWDISEPFICFFLIKSRSNVWNKKECPISR